MRFKKKYAKGGEIDNLLSYLQSKNKPTGLVKPQEYYAQPAVAESTRTQQAFLPDLENERFKQVLADRYLQSRQNEVTAAPTPETNKMYSGQAETALGATLMTPIGDVADIASGIKSFAEAEGFAQKALAAGETGAAMALMLAPVNLTQLKGVIKSLRKGNYPEDLRAADYLEAISESGSDFKADADLAESMGLGVEEVNSAIDALRSVSDDIFARNNYDPRHPDYDNIEDLVNTLEDRLYDTELGSSRTFNPDNLKEEIGSFKMHEKTADSVTWKDYKGNSVVLTSDVTPNPKTGETEEIYSIDAFGFSGTDAGSPARVFTEALLAVPVGSNFYSSSMSADSYPLFLKFLSGRKGRAPKAEVNTDYDIQYSPLNSLGGKAQGEKLAAGGLDSYFGLSKDQLDKMTSYGIKNRDELVPIKEALDKRLAEAGLPEAEIKEYTSSFLQETVYMINVPYPVIKRTEEGFKYGGIMSPLKRQKNSLSIKKRNV